MEYLKNKDDLRRDKKEDDVANFLQSLIPDVRSLSRLAKIEFKMKVLELLKESMIQDEANNIKQGNVAPVYFVFSLIE